MTSTVIPLVVGTILVIVCFYIAFRLVINGEFESSGYRMDWRSNPIGMTVTLIMLMVCPVIIVWGFCTQWPSEPNAPNDHRFRIIVEIHPDARPQFSYEGPGVERAITINRNDAGEFHFSFSAMTLPPNTAWELDGTNDLKEYRVFEFVGKLACSNGKCRLEGELQSREYGDLVISGLHEKATIRPGANKIAFQWNQ